MFWHRLLCAVACHSAGSAVLWRIEIIVGPLSFMLDAITAFADLARRRPWGTKRASRLGKDAKPQRRRTSFGHAVHR